MFRYTIALFLAVVAGGGLSGCSSGHRAINSRLNERMLKLREERQLMMAPFECIPYASGTVVRPADELTALQEVHVLLGQVCKKSRSGALCSAEEVNKAVNGSGVTHDYSADIRKILNKINKLQLNKLSRDASWRIETARDVLRALAAGDGRTVQAWNLMNCLVSVRRAGQDSKARKKPEESSKASDAVTLKPLLSVSPPGETSSEQVKTWIRMFGMVLERHPAFLKYMLLEPDIRNLSVTYYSPASGQEKKVYVLARLLQQDARIQKRVMRVLFSSKETISLDIGGVPVLIRLVRVSPVAAREVLRHREDVLKHDNLKNVFWLGAYTYGWFASAVMRYPRILRIQETDLDGMRKTLGQMIVERYQYIALRLLKYPKLAMIPDAQGIPLALRVIMKYKKGALAAVRSGLIFDSRLMTRAGDPLLLVMQRYMEDKEIMMGILRSDRFFERIRKSDPRLLQFMARRSPDGAMYILQHRDLYRLMDDRGVSPVHFAVTVFPEAVDEVLGKCELYSLGRSKGKIVPDLGSDPLEFYRKFAVYLGRGRPDPWYQDLHPGDTVLHYLFRNGIRNPRFKERIHEWASFVVHHTKMALLRNSYGETVAHVIAAMLPEGWKLVEEAGLAKVKDNAGMTPMHYAAAADSKAAVSIARKPSLAALRDAQGRTVLHMAVLSSSQAAFDVLKDRRASEMEDDYGYSVVHYAALNPEVAPYIVKHPRLSVVMSDSVPAISTAAYGVLVSEKAAVYAVQHKNLWSMKGSDGRMLLHVMTERFGRLARYVSVRSELCRVTDPSSGKTAGEVALQAFPADVLPDVLSEPTRCFETPKKAADAVYGAMCSGPKKRMNSALAVKILDHPQFAGTSPALVECAVSTGARAAVKFMSAYRLFGLDSQILGQVLRESVKKYPEVAVAVVRDAYLASLHVPVKSSGKPLFSVSGQTEKDGGDEGYVTLAHVAGLEHESAAREILRHPDVYRMEDDVGRMVLEVLVSHRSVAWRILRNVDLASIRNDDGVTMGHLVLDRYPDMARYLRGYDSRILAGIKDEDGTSLLDVVKNILEKHGRSGAR